MTFRRMLWIFMATGMLLIATVASPSAQAQSSTGTVQGLVTDQSGSTVPGAQLVLKSDSTGQTRTASSSDVGTFEIPYVLPDIYTLTISKTGFDTVVITGIHVSVGEVANETAKLNVGTVSQQVEVTAQSAQVDATTPTLGAVMEYKEITTLPILGRSFLTLATLSAGTVANYPGSWTGTFSGSRTDMAVAVSGSQDFSTTNLIDGVPTKSPEYGGIGYQLPLEMVDEFNIQRGFYSAKYSGPGVVNVVSRSGKNDIHGVLWYTFGNDVLDAKNYFDTTKPALRQNQFGGAFGGPILKNRLFYFGNIQVARNIIGFTQQGTVPTAAELQGNLSDISSPIVNPFTGAQYPGNVIPAASLDPFAKAYIGLGNRLIPAPTVTGVPFGQVNRIVASDEINNDFYYDIRVDYNISQKDQIFARWGAGDSSKLQPSLSEYTVNSPYNAKNMVIGWTHVFSPSLISEAHFGLDRVHNRPTFPYGPGVGSEDFNSELGLVGSNSYLPCDAPPVVNIVSIAFSNGTCDSTNSTQFIYEENVSYIRGKHSLEFGGQAIRTQITNPIFNFPNGELVYTGQYTGNPLADFLLGYPQTVDALTKVNTPYRRSWQFGLYGEDQYKVSKALTLDVGLRWELPKPAYDKYNNLAAFVASGGYGHNTPLPPNTPYTFALAGQNGVSRAIVKTNYADFSPRVGFAWQPFGRTKWAVRGSFGVFYETLVFDEESFNSLGYPVVFPYQATSDPTLPSISPEGQFGSANPTIGGFELSEDPNRSDPYHEQWTISIQRELPASMLLTTAYVGNHGVHLFKRMNYNVAQPGTTPLADRLPFTGLGSILYDQSIGVSDYNALQVDLDKRYSQGMTFHVGYTYANANDDAQTSQNSNYLPWNPKGDYQRSDYNLKHNFVFSGNYLLPFGQGQRFASSASGFLNQLISGWNAVGIVSAHTGFPVSGPNSTDLTNTLAGGFGGRPNQVCSGALSSGRSIQHWFDANCFPAAPPNTFGNAHQGIITAPNYVDADLSALKNTKLSEKLNLQLRVEFFNAFNKPNFDAPNSNVSSSLVGQILSAEPSRQIQGVFRLVW
jgi:outer membrane receptor protein involved in Fe transport